MSSLLNCQYECKTAALQTEESDHRSMENFASFLNRLIFRTRSVWESLLFHVNGLGVTVEFIALGFRAIKSDVVKTSTNSRENEN